MSTLREMFFIFFRIGALTLGGGYVMIPIMEDEIVHKRKWITEKDFIDILAIAQSFPGAIAINTSIYVGYKIKRHRGALTACLGLILPPFLIISSAAALILSYGDHPFVKQIFMGVRPAVAGLIAAAVVRLSNKLERSTFNLVMGMAAFVAVAVLEFHPIAVILASGGVGYMTMRGMAGDDE
jgi:chromate transporter